MKMRRKILVLMVVTIMVISLAPTFQSETNRKVTVETISRSVTFDKTSPDEGNNPSISTLTTGAPDITFNSSLTSISITSNADFSTYASSGSGTQGDPWMISGYNLTSSGNTLMSINNVNEYFVVEDNIIDGVDKSNYAISTFVSKYGTFRNNNISNAYNAFLLTSSHNMTIDNNYISNIGFEAITSSTYGSENITIVDNIMQNIRIGISLGHTNTLSRYHEIYNNTITNLTGDYGISLTNTVNTQIIHNRIIDNAFYGIYFDESNNGTVSENYIDGVNNGIYFAGGGTSTSEYFTISDNEIINTFTGISEDVYSEFNVVSNNEIHSASNYGIYINGDNSTYSNNTFTGSSGNYGIYINTNTAANNTLLYNVVIGYDLSVATSSLDNAGNNNLTRNDFINATITTGQFLSDNTDTYLNIYAFNYYSHHNNTDANEDGIADNPYILDGTSSNSDPTPSAGYNAYAKYVETGPIDINSNADILNWAVDGSGSAFDPYIIEGYNVTSSAANLIDIQGTTDHIIIRDNLFDGLDGSVNVLYMNNADNIEIENNIFQNSRYGIYIVFSDHITFSSNEVSNIARTDFPSLTEYVTFSRTKSGIIKNNEIDVSIGYGIAVDDANQTLVYNNTLTDIGSAGGGIYDSQSLAIWGYDTKIYNNTISDFNNNIWSKSRYAQIYNNIISSANTNNLLLEAPFSKVFNNTISDASTANIRVDNDFIDIYNNTLTGASNAGIRLELNSVNITMSDNTLTGNNIGIYWVGTSINNIITRNSISGGSRGLYVSMSSSYYLQNIIIDDNTITSTSLDGISLVTTNTNSKFIYITNNTITATGHNAIYASVGGGLNITHNYMFDLGRAGLQTVGGSGIWMMNNTVEDFYWGGVVNTAPSNIDSIYRFNNFLVYGGSLAVFDIDNSGAIVEKNYYSDHDNTDANEDGFADTAYTLDGNLGGSDATPLAGAAETVIVNDDTNPSITSNPGSLVSVNLNDASPILSWSVSDANQGSYIISDGTSEIQTGSWFDGSTISYTSADTSVIGTTTYTMTFTDIWGNSASHSVDVQVEDSDAPVITESISSTDIIFGEVATKTWTATDSDASTYDVYIDQVLESSGNSWTSGVQVAIDVSGLSLGNHNLTIVARDGSGNEIVFSGYFDVVDGDAPVLSETPSSSYSISYTQVDLILVWNATDPSTAGTQYLYIYDTDTTINSTLINGNFWTNATEMTYNFGSYGYGTYIITATFFDSAGNGITHQVTLTVYDDVNPVPTSVPANTDQQLNTNIQYTWAISDESPVSYQRFVSFDNGAPSSFSDSWDGSDVTYTYSAILSNGIGTGNVTMIFYDADGNTFKHTLLITVVDTIAPSINSPWDTTYELGTSGNSITWTVQDPSDMTYSVTNDGSAYVSGAVSGGTASSNIVIDIDGLFVGTYTFIIIVTDAEGNSNSDTVNVTVEDTLSPVVPQISDLTYELGSTSNELTWSPVDDATMTYNVTKDGVSIASGTVSGDVIINVDGLDLGSYTYIITVTDASGNFDDDTVIVTVEDTTAPLFTSIPADRTLEYGTVDEIVTFTFEDLDLAGYYYYVDNVENGPIAWTTSPVSMPFTLDSFRNEFGQHNITVLVYDGSGNEAVATILVTTVDTTAPLFTSVPADRNLEYGTLNEEIIFTFEDLDLAGYYYYMDNVENGPTAWTTSPVSLSFTLDSFRNEFGQHNITVLAYDGSGNEAVATVLITTVDTTAPVVDNPTDFSYGEGSTGNVIAWTASDLDAGTYTVTKDGVSFVTATSWTSDIAVNVNVDEFAVGSYTMVITFEDGSGNTVSDTVIVSVADGTNPTVTSPADVNYELADTGSTIIWTPSDTYPGTYTVEKDKIELISSTIWTDNTDIEIDVSGLAVGTYNYTIIVKDLGGNEVVDTVIVTVSDTVSPEVSSPVDLSLELGTTSEPIIWTATDLDAGTYTISIDGTEVVSQTSWTSGTAVSYTYDALATGVYSVVITFSDVSGNTVSDEVLVTITDSVAPTVNTPNDLSFEEGTTGNSISWTANDLNAFSYSITQDGSEVDTGSWTSGTAVKYSVDGLTEGTYEFVITFQDGSGNSVTDTVLVTVTAAPIDTSEDPIDTTTTPVDPPAPSTEEESPGFGFFISILVLIAIPFVKRRD